MGEVVSQFLPLMGCACKLQVIQWPVHSAMLNNALRCVAFTSALVEMQRDARIDSDPVLAFLCVGSLRVIAKKSLKVLARKICVSRINKRRSCITL